MHADAQRVAIFRRFRAHLPCNCWCCFQAINFKLFLKSLLTKNNKEAALCICLQLGYDPTSASQMSYQPRIHAPTRGQTLIHPKTGRTPQQKAPTQTASVHSKSMGLVA